MARSALLGGGGLLLASCRVCPELDRPDPESRGPSRVDTVMIQGADHMYSGEEESVAEIITQWVDTLVHDPSSESADPVKPRDPPLE